jgi:hypothetical protein
VTNTSAITLVNQRYTSVRCRAYGVGDGLVLLDINDGRRVEVVPERLAILLGHCVGDKAIAQHAAYISSALSASPMSALSEGLEVLHRMRLLIPSETPCDGEAAEPPGSTAPIAAVVTANRPQRLEPCLRTIVAEATAHGYLVVDGTKQAEGCMAARQALRRVSAARPEPFWYFGPDDVQAVVLRLAQTTREKELLMFALAGGTAGANRNVVALLTAGHSVVMCDDDVVCSGRRQPSRDEGFTVAGHEERRVHRFFWRRADVPPTSVAGPFRIRRLLSPSSSVPSTAARRRRASARRVPSSVVLRCTRDARHR